MSKYKSKKTTINGITFDSKKEAGRYLELKEQHRVGYISSLSLQPEFILQESFKKNGKTIRAIKYRADFSYWKDQKRIIEDVKGMQTKVFKIKKKMFEYKFQDLELKLV